jgi:site-specific DNA-methyltransferase (adenine-specific)/site-specific DNA-methyltransferase (cytosine-N4-specific)
MNQILHGDCLFMLKRFVPDASVDLIVTSPPYAQQRSIGVRLDRYERWLLERAREFKRVLKPTGSFVLNLWPHTEGTGLFKGQESTYVMDLIIALREAGWRFIDTYIWRKTNGVPARATNKLKNGWEPFYHLAKRTKIKFCPDQVMRPAKPSSIKRAERLNGKDLERRTSASGSGFSINAAKATRRYRQTGSGVNFVDTPASICNADGMVLPDNVIECACETRNLGHDSVFPEKLPAFFINLLTRKGDVVLDPFSGSGTTAFVAKQLERQFIAIDKEAKNVGLIQERLSAR